MREEKVMFCLNCSDKIPGKPIRQGGEIYCSLECANKASGIEQEDTEEYFEEDSVDGFYKEDE